MRVRYTDTALREIDEIFAFVAERNITAAVSVRARVVNLVGQLSHFPYMAQETELRGVRQLPLAIFHMSFFTLWKKTRW